MSPKVFAVVVTFNRKDLLAECLEALKAQTRPCDGILVIDNASTDGTDLWLATQDHPQLISYRMSRNTGGAGGFNAGMRLAYQAGADLLWLMDDDVIADPTALEALMAARATLQARNIDSAYLVSSAWTPEGLATNVPDIYYRQNSIDYADWGACLDQGLVAVRRATFVSILFERSVLDRFGLPIAPMFIWADDSEYTIRVTHKTPGFAVGPSRVVHVRAASGVPSLASETNPVRIGFHRYLIRNTAYLTRTHFGRQALIRYWRSQLGLMRKLFFAGQAGKAKVVASALIESLSFKPVVEQPGQPASPLNADLVRL